MAQIVLAAFGLMFLLDAIDKVSHLRRSIDSISSYELLPQPLHGVAAVLLAITGFAAGAALLGRISVGAAAAVGAGLQLLFALGMAINLIRGRRDLECGCGTAASGQRLQWRLVMRNVVVAVVLVAAAATDDVGAPLSVAEVLPGAFGLALVYLAVSAVWASGSQQQWRLGSM